MTDLEITRLCAIAMEDPPTLPGNSDIWGYERDFTKDVVRTWVRSTYNPLHDDAQAMALVKKTELWIKPPGQGHLSQPPSGKWFVAHSAKGGDSRNTDLNRAICECVAKIA